MHVVMFGDQHVESLGGAQVSMRLQRRFLEINDWLGFEAIAFDPYTPSV